MRARRLVTMRARNEPEEEAGRNHEPEEPANLI
jgi:hypothetical protein